ncbi:hypothetical protein [Sphingobacterium bovisgrunnientis]|uniref:hypothetical protein n=1 Tax=Sphingobacterium bovisgrunnientis TaxID=1874697 RepID=UPI0013590B99|nr:hypothetical protein [Sphingobacterium bovisgrunnientis]
MHIKFKINQILNRISYVLSKEIKGQFNSEYVKGFEHAVKLFGIAVFNEFGKYVQIESNKIHENRELKKEVERLNTSLGNSHRYIDHLENMLIQANQVKLSNTKKKKIFKAIEEMTGQPYLYVREQFLELVEGKGAKSA